MTSRLTKASLSANQENSHAQLHSAAWAATLTILLMPSGAMAANRTVCFQLKFYEDRTDCPDSNDPGARRPCQDSGDLVPAVGHYVELWDKDYLIGDGDDYIGTWVKSQEGTGCATFAWEGAPYAGSEANPDVYLQYIHKVRQTGCPNCVRAYALDENGNVPPKITWRNGEVFAEDLYVAVDCAAGSNCMIFGGSSLVPTVDETSESAIRIMQLDSAQHTFQVFGDEILDDIAILYPSTVTGSFSQTLIEMADDSNSYSGVVVPHELGHSIHKQQFGQNDLQSDCSFGGATHALTSLEYDSCATAEGWADFVAAASWWDETNAASVPTGWGFDFESATPAYTSLCSDNRGVEGQAARGFWDLIDVNNETAVAPAVFDDTYDGNNAAYLTAGWDLFPNGTANREDYENDIHGVNLRDYVENNVGRFPFGSLFVTLQVHNCTESQDFN